jgi:uncharacterized protein (TIGR03546 family)
MILWTIKLLSTAKKAIAGRKYPHQLAWATAFGLLLGIVPHGNLAAVAIVVLVLSLKINHAMVALTAIATTFLVATRIDPLAHMIGDIVLTHPEINSIAVSAWRLPLVPWTDLNNTVVMGSLLIGVTSLIPVFVVTYPIFRLFAPAVDSDAEVSERSDTRAHSTAQRPADARKKEDSDHQIVMVDRGHDRVASPHSGETVDFQEVRSESTNDDPVNQVAVQTRIDVIRMKGSTTIRSVPNVGGANTEQTSADTQATKEQPMDEALNYLLRQLRDSQQRSAA